MTLYQLLPQAVSVDISSLYIGQGIALALIGSQLVGRLLEPHRFKHIV